jgi:hypothetical protein
LEKPFAPGGNSDWQSARRPDKLVMKLDDQPNSTRLRISRQKPGEIQPGVIPEGHVVQSRPFIPATQL